MVSLRITLSTLDIGVFDSAISMADAIQKDWIIMENETKTAAENFMSSLEDMQTAKLLNDEEWRGVVDMRSAREAVRAIRYDGGADFLARNIHMLLDAKKADRHLSNSLWEVMTVGCKKISGRPHTTVDWNFMAISLLALIRPEALMLEALRIPEVGKTLYEVSQYE